MSSGSFLTLDDFDIAGKAVIVRQDLNVPLKDGKVANTSRIVGAVPTLREILSSGGTPIILSHLGRPGGRADPAYSLEVVCPVLERRVGHRVQFCSNFQVQSVKQAARDMNGGGILLLENVRFFPEEMANDVRFAQQLAAFGDIFCNDAFSASHRAHASVSGIARFLPTCAGRLMEKELKALDSALANPERPVVAIVGGAKISSKIAVLSRLIDMVDHLIIGGAMANSFLLAKGWTVGTSLVEADRVEQCQGIMAQARKAGCRIALPVDIVTAPAMQTGMTAQISPVATCPADQMILDCGPETVDHYARIVAQCRSLVWNGPLGAFEIPPFNAGTETLLKAVRDRCANGQLTAVAGGGDTVAAIDSAGFDTGFTYVSRAGGAFLEWLEGRELPGLSAMHQ